MTWPGWSISVQVAFNDNVWATSPTWTDITKYATKITTSMGRQHELQQVNPSTAVIELTNQPVSAVDNGGRFSPWNTASPYYNSGNGLTPGHPVRIRATISGTTYNVFYGYTQSWVPKYGQSSSSVTLNCYDGMALLNLAMMDVNLYEPQVIADGATAYWTCQDAVGSSTFADATGNGNTATLTGVGAFGGTAGALRAVADACCTFGTSSSPGSGLLDAPVAPSSIATLMFEGWFQTTGTSQTLMSWECVAVAAGATGTSLVIDATGHPALYNGLLDGPIPTSGSGVPLTIYAQATTPTNDGDWHHYVVAVPNSSANTTWSLYVDGVLVGSTASTSVAWEPPTGHDFLAGGYWTEPAGTFYTVAAFTGAMDQVAYYATPLNAAQIANHYALGSAGFVVQDSGARTAVVLEDLAGIPSALVNCDTGVVQLQGATSALNQTTVSSYLQQVENTERGMLYQDATGVLRFLNREHVYTNPNSVNSQFTFTYDGSGQYYYSSGLVPAEDDTDLWNDINVGRQGGTVQNANDSTSISKYGRRSLQGYTSLLFASDADAQALAGGLRYQYKNPSPRVRAIQTSSTVNGGAALPHVLALNLLDRVTIVWRPIDGSSANFSQQSLVEQVQHTISPGQWDTTLAVTPIGTENFALWDSATWDSGEWGF